MKKPSRRKNIKQETMAEEQPALTKHTVETTTAKGTTDQRYIEGALIRTNERLRVLQQVMEAVHSTLELDEVFRRIIDGAVHSLGYDTVLIMVINDKKKRFEVKSLAARKQILSGINKILGFSLNKLSVPVEPELNATIKAVMEGKVMVNKTLADIAYPIINKTACLAIQKLAGTKSHITVPFKKKEEIEV